MENRPCLVSVLCTAYNHEEYIRSALEGFVNQKTDFAFEVLVNDDASTDKTAEIIREYAEKYPDIIRPFYHEENQFSKGIGYVYENIFYPNARGKYLAFCEGDDCWTDDTKLRRQAEFMEAHPDYSACVHNTLLHYCDGSRPDEPLVRHEQDMDLPFECIIKGPNNAYHTSSLFARKELVTRTPDFYRTATAYGFADYAWGLMLGLGGKLRFINRTMSLYRICSNQCAWSSGVDGCYDKLKGFVRGKAEMLKVFLPHAPEEYRALTEQVILEREFELMYIEGRDKEQRREPYRSILRRQSLSYRLKNFAKSYFPGLQRMYRRRRGYGDY